MTLLMAKFKENMFAMIPIILTVFFVELIAVDLSLSQWMRFLIGSIFIITGLSLFLVGVDIAITPLGGLIGSQIAKTNRLMIVIVAGLVLGFVISIAEPGLLVFSQQVNLVTQGTLSSSLILIVVSIGLALFVACGFMRIIFNIPLYKILIVIYLIIGVLAIGTSELFFAISFDASGATTGILAVPFLLALSLGISRLKKDHKSSEKDAFGLVAIASGGAVISLLILGYFMNDLSFADTIDLGIVPSNNVIMPFVNQSSSAIKDTLLSFSPLFGIFILMQVFGISIQRKQRYRMMKGFVYTILGLFMFLVGVNAGFMEVGQVIGSVLAEENRVFILIITGFFLGLFTIIAEPAVSVLTHQIEQMTSGYVKRKLVLIPLSLGVGLAISLSMIRIVTPGLQLWHILLPGYVLSLLMMFFVPKLFVGIAFDAGGVATGPLTATFVLAFVQGAANAYESANVVIDGFGMIALVALAPIITLQILGFFYKIKTRKVGVQHE